MSPRRKGRQIASFHGIEIKLQRSYVHLDQLQRGFGRRTDSDAYRFKPEVKDDGAKHIYRADRPPADADDWGLIAGDCVHTLRSALDHLAWQLVISNDGHPGPTTSFPIWSRQPKGRIPIIRHPRPLRVAGGIAPKALAMIEEVQPYKGTDPGSMGLVLRHLADLDILDKHRQFITTTSVVGKASTSGQAVVDNPSIENMRMRFTGQPIKHDRVVAVAFYDPPLPEPDPNLRFTPAISFGRGMPLAGERVEGVLWTLWQRTSTYLTSFKEFFPNFPE